MSKITLKKEESVEVQKEKIYSLKSKNKGLDAKKYSGILQVNEDPLEYQKRIRKEWDETSS